MIILKGVYIYNDYSGSLPQYRSVAD